MFSKKHAGVATRSDFGGAFHGLAKLRFAVVVTAVAAFLPTAPSSAQTFAFVSAGGSGACTATAPCSTVAGALSLSNQVDVTCLNGSAEGSSSVFFTATNSFVDVNCPLGFLAGLSFSTGATNATVRVRHLVFKSTLAVTNLLVVEGGGTLILEDCVFADATGTAIDIEPVAPLTLVIRNSRISNGATGILLKPAAGGSINATLDHVTITKNSGGGLKIDTTNGAVTTDISDSVVSDNGGNGINAVAGASQNIVSIERSVIAKNGAAGVQANGVNAGVLLQMTLLDQNVAGATSVVSGGNMFTYGNNSIVGGAGSGFNHTAGLQ